MLALLLKPLELLLLIQLLLLELLHMKVVLRLRLCQLTAQRRYLCVLRR